MSGASENAMLNALRRLDEKLDRIDAKLNDVINRVGHVHLAVAQHGVTLADLSTRMDGTDRYLRRIEERLYLLEETLP